MYKFWVIEEKSIDGEYFPAVVVNSRDEARRTQRAYKLLGKLINPSRIRRYERIDYTRG